ncbi:MAG TPA: hypothetical protein VGF14_07965 [Alphaproteobacteria bacterium]
MTKKTFAEAAQDIEDKDSRVHINRILRVQEAFSKHPDEHVLPLKKIHKMIRIWADSAEELVLRQPKLGHLLLAETVYMTRSDFKAEKKDGMNKALRQLKSAGQKITNEYYLKKTLHDIRNEP